MKVIVFIRQIVNPQIQLEGVDYFDMTKVTDDDLVINPFDKNALEGALKIKDKLGATVTAVCVRGKNPVKALREAIAMGCDDAIAVDNAKIDTEDPYILSKVYAKVLEKMGEYDLVLTGAEENGYISYADAVMLAEITNLPAVFYAEELDLKENSIVVSHTLEGGKQIVEMPMKGLLSCVDSQYFTPRYTSMRGILKAKRAQIPTWSLADLGLTEEEVGEAAAKLQKVSLENIVIEKESYILKDEEPEEMVDKLLKKLKEDGIKLGA